MDEPSRVDMGQLLIRKEGRLTCVGLGSCIGVVLYDSMHRVGALAHVMLPSFHEANSPATPGKFADSAVETMVEEMRRWGCSPCHMSAKLFGGANMFPEIMVNGTLSIGQRNIEATREQLLKQQIPIVAEAVGGNTGRTIVLDTQDGSVTVRTIKGDQETY